MRFSSFICLSLIVFTLAPKLRAEDAVTPARALFNEGRELVGKGDYAAACPKFEQSLALEGGLGTQFNLADCWEHVGKTASAQQLFLGAAASAKASGQVEREQVLRDRANALNPRISKLVIEVEATDTKLIVKRDDLPLEQDAWGKAVVVDPGTYRISAKAPHKKPWSKTIEVKASSAAVVTVSVPELEPLKPKTETEPDEEAASAEERSKPRKANPAPSVEGPQYPERDRSLNYKVLGIGAFGLGAVALGTVMGFRFMSANDEAKSICPSGKSCSDVEIERHANAVDRATTDRTWSYIGFGAGGASLLLAAALAIFEPARPSSRSALHASPQLGKSGVFGATIDGSF